MRSHHWLFLWLNPELSPGRLEFSQHPQCVPSTPEAQRVPTARVLPFPGTSEQPGDRLQADTHMRTLNTNVRPAARRTQAPRGSEGPQETRPRDDPWEECLRPSDGRTSKGPEAGLSLEGSECSEATACSGGQERGGRREGPGVLPGARGSHRRPVGPASGVYTCDAPSGAGAGQPGGSREEREGPGDAASAQVTPQAT